MEVIASIIFVIGGKNMKSPSKYKKNILIAVLIITVFMSFCISNNPEIFATRTPFFENSHYTQGSYGVTTVSSDNDTITHEKEYWAGNLIVNEFSNMGSEEQRTSSKTVVIKNCWVEGDIIVVVEKVFATDEIVVIIQDNPIVYGNISVRMSGNVLKEGYNASGELKLYIQNNGENTKDKDKNQAVGSINVQMDHNFGARMDTHIDNNWIHNDININIKDRNQMSYIMIHIFDNHVGSRLEFDFIDNDIDRDLMIEIIYNEIGEQMKIDISRNPHFGFLDYKCPASILIEIRHNHVSDNVNINSISINGNYHYGPGLRFEVNISDNGFRGTFTIEITGNKALSMAEQLWIYIYNNKCGINMGITVSMNDYKEENKHKFVCGNTAGELKPDLVLDGGVKKNDSNIQQNPQEVGGDSDGDGLSDEYEKMIGTINVKDTDHDGLVDGWEDIDRDMTWDRGEKLGEIGDPRQKMDDYRNWGSISTLFKNSLETPNPINKDIYVEIDFVEDDCKIETRELTDVKNTFARHCIHLHIDLGWDIEEWEGSKGGETFPRAGFTRGGRNWLYFNPDFPRRLLRLIDDFYDFKIGLTDRSPTSYFSGGRNGVREDVFHYAISANNIAQWDKGLVLYVGVLGSSEIGGDDFILGSLALADCGYANYLDRLFMHELGHNLRLHHSIENDGTDLDNTVNPWPLNDYTKGDAELSETVSSTVMHWNVTQSTRLDYLREEWSALDLTRVCDGTHGRYS